MSRVPCPKCATPLDDDQEVCGYCRRRRDPGESAAARRAPPGAPASAPTFPVETVVWTVLALGAVAAAVRWRGELAAGASSVALAVTIAANLVGPAPAAAPAPTPAPPPAAVPADAPPSPACRAPSASPRVTRADDSYMVAYGVVSDLLTGCAVPGGLVTLLSANGTTGRTTRTDGDGVYQLPFDRAAANPALSVTAAGYRAGQLEDQDPPLRARPPAERRAFAAETNASDMEPVLLAFPPSAIDVRTDIVLIPAP